MRKWTANMLCEFTADNTDTDSLSPEYVKGLTEFIWVFRRCLFELSLHVAKGNRTIEMLFAPRCAKSRLIALIHCLSRQRREACVLTPKSSIKDTLRYPSPARHQLA